MKSFIILGFLAAAASAGVLPGYQYGPGVSGVRQEILVGGSGHGSIYNTAPGISYSIGGLTNSGKPASVFISNGGYTGNSIISSGNFKQTGSTVNLDIDAVDSVPPAVQYSKQFYHFDAPAESHSDGIITRQLSNSLKKNLQVVFIKAPENTAATNAALQLAKQAIEQRTAIYVLTKQNDHAQLVGKLQQIQENVQTKPEVRFVKYRTPEDIQRAKASIQSQYDNFGGLTENYNAGIAPVLNYASDEKPSQIIFDGSNKAFGSVYGSGSKIGTTKNVVRFGTIFNSGSSLSSTASPAITSTPQSIESANKTPESGSIQTVEIASLDSAPIAATGSYIDNFSYLPPTSLKK